MAEQHGDKYEVVGLDIRNFSGRSAPFKVFIVADHRTLPVTYNLKAERVEEEVELDA